MADKTKIMFVSHKSGLGGAERSLLQLVKLCLENNYDVQVLTPESGKLTTKLEELGVPYHIIPFKHWVSPVKNPVKRLARKLVNRIRLPKVVELIKNQKIDLVYTNTLTVPVGAKAANKLGLPHIWHIREFGDLDHGYYFDYGKSTFRRISGWSHQIIVNSHAVREHFTGHISADKMKVIYNPVAINTPSVHRQKTGSDFGFLLPGAIQPGKRQEDAINAFTKLAAEFKKTTLSLAGSGIDWYREKIVKMAKESPFADRIRILSYIENPEELYEHAFVVLMTSRCEAFGNVTVEALSRGIPVIGSNCGGTREIIDDQKTGLLYEPCNVEDLYNKMKYAITHQDIMLEWGARAPETIKNKFEPSLIRKQQIQAINKTINAFRIQN